MENPLVIYDLETTGLDKQTARIIQICALKIWPGENINILLENLNAYKDKQSLLHDRLINVYVNPGMQVDAEVLTLTGITQAQLDGANPLEAVVEQILHIFNNKTHKNGKEYSQVDIAGFNSNKFDRYILENNLKRLGKTIDLDNRNLIDAFQIFIRNHPRTLAAAVKTYCGEEIEDAHNALGDVISTLKVVDAQRKLYAADEESNKILADLSKDPNWHDSQGIFKVTSANRIVICIGKHSGMSLNDLAKQQPGFLNWLIKNDFPEDTKDIARKALAGDIPEVTYVN
jgi:DNA polymerase-3 subunit epsilon